MQSTRTETSEIYECNLLGHFAKQQMQPAKKSALDMFCLDISDSVCVAGGQAFSGASTFASSTSFKYDFVHRAESLLLQQKNQLGKPMFQASGSC
uniref:Uncharacterized protein n=1 Tax=Steinernema glaseri TaxID=37863 RepID=A0A1I7YV99_9BILA